MIRFAFGVATGAIGMWIAVMTMGEVGNAWFQAIAKIVVACTVYAGLVAGRHGALAGFGALVITIIAVQMPLVVSALPRVAMDQDGCDPCGITGYLGRGLIIVTFALATFGLAGAVGGRFGEYLESVLRSSIRSPRETWARRGPRLAAALVVIALVGYATDARPVWTFHDGQCPGGLLRQPLGLGGGVYRCVARRPLPAGVDSAPMPVVSVERRVGLYLANPRLRIFDLDLERGHFLWLGAADPH